MSSIFHFAKSGHTQYIFGSPAAFKEMGEMFISYAKLAEQGKRQWGELENSFAFVCCLDDKDAEKEAENFRVSQN